MEYYTKEMSPFVDAKEKYNAMREFERKKIINYLITRGLKPSQTGGMGFPCYTSGGKLQRSYDLTNWKWVTVSVGNNKFLISLQAFDRDKKSYHVLMDRIGICRHLKTDKNPDYYKSMEITSLELPLDEKDLDELHILLSE